MQKNSESEGNDTQEMSRVDSNPAIFVSMFTQKLIYGLPHLIVNYRTVMFFKSYASSAWQELISYDYLILLILRSNKFLLIFL